MRLIFSTATTKLCREFLDLTEFENRNGATSGRATIRYERVCIHTVAVAGTCTHVFVHRSIMFASTSFFFRILVCFVSKTARSTDTDNRFFFLFLFFSCLVFLSFVHCISTRSEWRSIGEYKRDGMEWKPRTPEQRAIWAMSCGYIIGAPSHRFDILHTFNFDVCNDMIQAPDGPSHVYTANH